MRENMLVINILMAVGINITAASVLLYTREKEKENTLDPVQLYITNLNDFTTEHISSTINDLKITYFRI